MKVDWKSEVETMKEMGREGKTLVDIATKYGVSRERVRQVVSQYIPTWKDEYGWAVVRKEKQTAYERKWGEKVDTDVYQAQRQRFRQKKQAAKYTGWTWDIQFGDIQWPTHCPILDLELDWFAESRQENSPSFDRFDTNLGYETGNVQIISWRANRIKNDGTADEHERIAQYMKTLKTS